MVTGTPDPVLGREGWAGWICKEGSSRQEQSPALAAEWWGSIALVPCSAHQAQLEAQRQQALGAGTAAEEQQWQPNVWGLYAPRSCSCRGSAGFPCPGRGRGGIQLLCLLHVAQISRGDSSAPVHSKPHLAAQFSKRIALPSSAWILAQHTSDTMKVWHSLCTCSLSQSIQLPTSLAPAVLSETGACWRSPGWAHWHYRTRQKHQPTSSAGLGPGIADINRVASHFASCRYRPQLLYVTSPPYTIWIVWALRKHILI